MYLSHARLCTEIGLLMERGVVEECVGAAQGAFHVVCVFPIIVTVTAPNRIWCMYMQRLRLLWWMVLLSREMTAASCSCHTHQSAAVRKKSADAVPHKIRVSPF